MATTVSDILKLNSSDINSQTQSIDSIIEAKNFKVLQEALVALVNDGSKQALAVSYFFQLEDKYIKVEEGHMEQMGLNLLQLFLSKKNSAFNRAEYKIRGQLADIFINVKGDFDKGIQYYIEADQQQERLGNGLEVSERKELQYEVICNIAYQYFQNEKAEYCRDWIKKLADIGQYIQQFEQSISTPEQKKKYEKRIQTLKLQRNNYFYLKANEEDSKKNFLRAAKLYLAFVKELNPNDPAIEANLIESLDSAIICAVLGEAGPLRSNIVAQLYQDKSIEKSSHKDLLYKTHQNRIINEKDREKLVQSLKAHQKAEDNTYELSQTFSIYEKAITEHNIIACTNLFETISSKSLAEKLMISQADTELILQTMINKGNLKAKIDQTTDFITFLQYEQIPVDFNDRISNYCGKVNDYLEKIQREK